MANDIWYAILNESGEVIDRRLLGPLTPDQIKKHEGKPLARPLIITKPAFNAATQNRTGPVTTIFDDRVEDVWTVTDKTAEEIQADKDRSRDLSMALFDGAEEILRAMALVIQDEMNLHAQRITAILDAVDGAASLAALKTAIAAVPDVPTRTPAQIRTAIRNKLGTNGG